VECFPEDFAITFNQPHLRDMAMDKRSFTVRGRVFVLRPWFPAARGVHRVWRWYCRVALDNLPLEAWNRDQVDRILGDDCMLDKIERQSETRQNLKGLFAWAWTWNPDLIPRANEYTMLNHPDVPCQRGALPEGVPTKEGKEGHTVTVLIHLDEAHDYSPLSPSSSPGVDRRQWPLRLTYPRW
jgi:hypothetical protein